MTNAVVLVFPLNNFHINETEEFVFSENIRIRKISDKERQTALKSKLITGKAGLIIPQFDFVLEEVASKEIYRYVYQAISSMRLLKAGNIEYTSIIRKKDPKIHMIPIMPCTHGHGFYILDPLELHELKELYIMTEQARSDPNIDLSLRRFNSSYAKGNIGDILLDLMISLETLYLSGESEKSFRLRSYITKFLEDKVENRIEMWHFIKTAYDLRSRIVHDGIRMPHKIGIKTQTEPIDVITFLNRIENYVRVSLRKFLEIESRNENLTVLKIRNFIEETIIDSKFDWNACMKKRTKTSKTKSTEMSDT